MGGPKVDAENLRQHSIGRAAAGDKSMGVRQDALRKADGSEKSYQSSNVQSARSESIRRALTEKQEADAKLRVEEAKHWKMEAIRREDELERKRKQYAAAKAEEAQKRQEEEAQRKREEAEM